MLRKVISGGQTGADQGALEGALLAGVSTGGYCPKGFKTETGANWDLLHKYHLQETESFGYLTRTQYNVEGSDGTLLIGTLTGGTAHTRKLCGDYRRPYFHFYWPGEITSHDPDIIANWILVHEIRVLNVAGNRESRNPGIYETTRDLILKVCGAINSGG